MDIQKAIDQIAEINRHLAKTEICRAIRSVPVGMTGIVAIAGSLMMPVVLSTPTASTFVTYWVALAMLNVALVSTQMAVEYLGAESGERNLIRRIIGQFFPAMAAGGVVTVVFTCATKDLVSYSAWTLGAHLQPGAVLGASVSPANGGLGGPLLWGSRSDPPHEEAGCPATIRIAGQRQLV
ncbi:MAG: hypothetical protein O2857_05910, partial [Planctomycetota bacterium]|nr:hypothetical protein [Planctomycetota bacterium]